LQVHVCGCGCVNWVGEGRTEEGCRKVLGRCAIACDGLLVCVVCGGSTGALCFLPSHFPFIPSPLPSSNRTPSNPVHTPPSHTLSPLISYHPFLFILVHPAFLSYPSTPFPPRPSHTFLSYISTLPPYILQHLFPSLNCPPPTHVSCAHSIWTFPRAAATATPHRAHARCRCPTTRASTSAASCTSWTRQPPLRRLDGHLKLLEHYVCIVA